MSARKYTLSHRWPYIRRRKDRRGWFIGLGIAATLLLVLVVAAMSFPGRDDRASIAPQLPTPDFARFLSGGATYTGPSVEISVLPQPSYVFASTVGDAAQLGLVVWDKERSKYVLAATVLLDDGGAGEAAPSRVSALSLESMGAAGQIIVARATGRSDLAGEFTYAIGFGGQSMGILPLTDDVGARRLAAFSPPAAEEQDATSAVTFEDADGDGRKEAIMVHVQTIGDVRRTEVQAFRFRDGEFLYDRDLSRLLTVSKGIFPEPPTPVLE